MVKLLLTGHGVIVCINYYCLIMIFITVFMLIELQGKKIITILNFV